MPTPPPLSKSLEKAETSSPLLRRSRHLALSGQQGGVSPTKSISSRRSVGSKARSAGNRRSHSGNSNTIREIIRNKNSERRGSERENDASVVSRSNHSVNSSTMPRTSSHDKKQKKANRPGAVSQFLKNTHRQLKADIAKIQDKIIFLQDLAPMKESKKVDLLFDMIDSDGGGTVDAEELATAMRKNNELSFSASIEKAIDMVATFDTNKDGELDKKEFHNYVSAMVKELDMTASQFSEYLIVQMVVAKETAKTEEQKLAGELAKEQIREEVKKREELFAILKDKNMENIFQDFDPESTGKVSFKHIAYGLYERTQKCDQEVQEAMEILLMMEHNDERLLNYEQFGRLIMAVSKTAEIDLDDLRDTLQEAAERLNTRDENYGSELVVDKGSVIECGDVDSLTYGRLKKLFRLWDMDGNGVISVTELANGLGAFQKASGIDVDASEMAQALINFDEDGDGELDPTEFAHAMVQYASQFGVEISGLIDAMVLLSSKAINEEKAEAFRDDFQDVFGASISFMTNLDDIWEEGD